MKKGNLLKGIAGIFAAALLFTSCSTTQHTAFNRQKYTDFKRGGEMVVNHLETRVIPSQDKMIAERPVAKQVTLTSSADNTPEVTYKPVLAAQVKKMIRKAIIHKLPEIKTAIAAEKMSSEQKSAKTISKENASSPSSPLKPMVETILLVLLAILIPPVAVYLKENRLTNNFWIDLLLCLLFYVPGIIFALLVVFDVV